jgi:hypothetical protein
MMYSQAFQDEFVDILLSRPTKGFFVDVGAGYDQAIDINSNSLMFEERGWEGIAIDGSMERMLGRKCKCVSCFIGDGSEGTVLLSDVLSANGCPNMVDYLSVDIEGNDYKAIASFVGGGYEFKIATIEHNLYSCNPGVDELKRDVFDLLTRNGYIRIVDNVGHMAISSDLHRGWPFEDWYINPKYVKYQETMNTIKTMKENGEAR